MRGLYFPLPQAASISWITSHTLRNAAEALAKNFSNPLRLSLFFLLHSWTAARVDAILF